MRQGTRRCAALGLCLALLLPLLPGRAAAAQQKVLLPEQARNQAVSNSPAIKKKDNQITLKEVKYVEAVNGIKAKIKNLRSFRWSPLLSFKFPQPLNMVAEYDLNIKPLTLQAEINTLKHEREDLRFAAIAEANKLYAEVYLLQEKIIFYQARLDTAQGELARNQVRLAAGTAVQADVKKMEKSVKQLTTELSNLKRKFQNKKEDLWDLTTTDVTSGYTFRSPFQTISLPRSDLNSVIDHTLNHDQGFYVAKMNASTALMNLNAYESLMRNQYGSKMGYIENFINMTKQGQDVDYSAFMLKYKEMLKELDRPWSYTIRILFFTFTMEWFKGEIDGTRYIEDEMYAIYSAAMEYASATKERDSTEKTLRKQVASQYELLITSWNAYQSLATLTADAKTQLDKVLALNKLGRADYSEVREARESYEDMQLDALDSLASYNTLLFDFDRLTCGAITKYMRGVDLTTAAGAGGDSFARLDPIHDPYYYIYTTVDDLTFHIGVSIPDDFLPTITDFEVWNGQIQIGSRISTTEELRHLTLDYGGDSMLTLRFYDGDNFVQQCDINAAVPRDRLTLIPAGEVIAEEGERAVGTYEVTTTAMGDLSTSTLTLKVSPGVGASSYSISYGTGNVFTSDPTPVDQPFHYLTLLVASLGDVALSLYDEGGTLIRTGRFDIKSQTIYGKVPK